MKTLHTVYKPLAALLFATVMLQGCNREGNSADEHTKTQQQEYTDRIENYRRQGEYRAAITVARDALQKNPKDRSAIAHLGAIFNELGQGKPAINVMEPLVADASRDEALIIAKAYFLQHKYQSALDYMQEATTRLSVKNDDAFTLLRAQALLGAGKIDDAEKALATISKHSMLSELEIARALRLRGNLEASKTHIDELLKRYPGDADILAEAAVLSEQQGQLDQTEDYLSKALITLPQTDILLPLKTEVLQRMVSTLTALRRSNEALVYTKALSDANRDVTAQQDKFKQGFELFQAGKLDEAEKILLEVYKDTRSDPAGQLLGMIRYSKNDLKGAAEYLTANVDPEVASDPAMAALAATQLRLEQPQKLLEQFDAKARAEIKNPLLKALIGSALLQTGNNAEGEQMVTAALEADSTNAAIRAILARHYLANGQPEKSIETLKTGLKLNADENLSRLLIASYLSAKKSELALSTAREFATSTPSLPVKWWTYGHTALALGKLDIAESALQNAIKTQPDYIPAQLDLARTFALGKKTDAAEALYRKILQQQPDSVEALKGLAVIFVQQGVQAKALEEKLLAVSATDNTRAVLAEYYLRQRKIDDMDQLLNAIPPSNGTTYVTQLKQFAAANTATLALQQRDFDGARKRILEGLKVNPGNTTLLLLLARTELGANQINEARKIADQLQSLQHDEVSLLELRGDLSMQEKQRTEAEKYYRQAWDKTHGDSIAAKLYQSLAGSDAASTFFAEWKQHLPNSDTAWLMTGLEAQNKKQTTAAIDAYEQAIKRNPNNALALNNLAWLYFEGGDKRALSTAERAHQLLPNNPTVLDTYGWILVQSKQKDKGLLKLNEAAALAPNSKEIQDHIEKAKKI